MLHVCRTLQETPLVHPISKPHEYTQLRNDKVISNGCRLKQALF